jgi:hypothetical protein
MNRSAAWIALNGERRRAAHAGDLVVGVDAGVILAAGHRDVPNRWLTSLVASAISGSPSPV